MYNSGYTQFYSWLTSGHCVLKHRQLFANFGKKPGLWQFITYSWPSSRGRHREIISEFLVCSHWWLFANSGLCVGLFFTETTDQKQFDTIYSVFFLERLFFFSLLFFLMSELLINMPFRDLFYTIILLFIWIMEMISIQLFIGLWQSMYEISISYRSYAPLYFFLIV